jgi:hypothetical protein
MKPWMKVAQIDLRPKKTSDVGIVDRKPTEIKSAIKLPRPPERENPASTTAAITGSTKKEPEFGLISGVKPAKIIPAIPPIAAAPTKVKIRRRFSEIPIAFADKGFPPTARK